MPPSSPPPRRRWFHVSLRGLMVLVLLVGGGAGWVAHVIRTQRAALAALALDQANLWFDYDYRSEVIPGSNPLAYRTGPAGPVWVRRLLGDELFQTVERVQWTGTIDDTLMAHLAQFHGLTDLEMIIQAGDGASLRHLRGLRRLERVQLSGASLGDVALGVIARSSRIEQLEIAGARATDAGFAELGRLRRLTTLVIADCPNLSDEGLARLLADLPPLQVLTITGLGPPALHRTLAAIGRHHRTLSHLCLIRTNVVDTDLAHLAGLPALARLDLGSTRITSAGLARLGPAAELEYFAAADSGVGDAGLPIVALWPKLRWLDLEGTPVTDAGLGALVGMPLGALQVGRTRVTDAGLAAVGRIATLNLLELHDLPGVTDAGLDALNGLTRLGTLDLGRTGVTAARINSWAWKLPGLDRVDDATGVWKRPVAPEPASSDPAPDPVVAP